MAKPTLYLLIGAPAAGKTTVSQIIAESTGAKHICADAERHKLFDPPTHSLEESSELYEKLNKVTEYLLSDGKSVVFDTNFNFYADRHKLRTIADKHDAQTVLLWLDTPVNIAKQRALDPSVSRNGYSNAMTEEQFDGITAKLEPPHKDEKYIKIDGTKLDSSYIKQILNL